MGGAFIAILVIGLAFAIAAYNNTASALWSQLETDVFGSGSGSGFLVWAGAIIFVSILGNVLGIPKTAKLFVILVLVVFVLQQQGLWANIQTAFTTTASPGTDSAGNTGQATTATGTAVAAPAVGTASGTGAASSTVNAAISPIGTIGNALSYFGVNVTPAAGQQTPPTTGTGT